jgi:hypothetical protein
MPLKHGRSGEVEVMKYTLKQIQHELYRELLISDYIKGAKK